MAVDQIATKGLVGEVLNSDPSNGAVDVTKSDTNDIHGVAVTVNSRPCRALYVGTTGDIKMTMADGTVVTRKNVPVGQWAWRVRQVWSTGTTASDIIADY